ncbi:MAG: hypothetical protein F6K16_09030 [Symploca sp. SIO2B6]|nr:hypothetical protein [Symploca sp. SIO2B6]
MDRQKKAKFYLHHPDDGDGIDLIVGLVRSSCLPAQDVAVHAFVNFIRFWQILSNRYI